MKFDRRSLIRCLAAAVLNLQSIAVAHGESSATRGDHQSVSLESEGDIRGVLVTMVRS